MKKYFLVYDEKSKVNYCFLFSLFLIAKSETDKLNNTITFKSLNDLKTTISEQCKYNISVSTISRILNDDNYNTYFQKEENKIILNTNFKRGNEQRKNKFVILNENEMRFLLSKKNKLLNKYYLYLKYYCGYSKSKEIDSTAEQILSAIGYSANCGNNKYSLCEFNAEL
jgi:hypothetical protein